MSKTILPLTRELLMDRLSYDPETGIFTRRVLRGGQKPGTIAGTLHWKGYIYIRLGNKKYYAHRLAFLYMTGSIPEQIDHVDCVRHNNRWSNLRAADSSINAQNLRSKNRANTSGFMGVTKRKDTGRFIAQISLNKKKFKIGSFGTAEEAHEAYLKKKREIHPGCTI